MKRYYEARDYVYNQFSKLYNPVLQMNAFCHTSSVDNFSTLLAISRGADLELAKISALFHDYARFVDNCPSRDHARLSSLYAHRYLTNSHSFSLDEIDAICCAIAEHSNKEDIDSTLSEVLKDADVLAHFAQDPTKTFKGVQQKRLIRACADLKD